MVVSLGQLQWDLPAQIEYQAGQALLVVASVTNPTSAAREYQLYLRYSEISTGAVLETLLVPVNEQQTFSVPEGSIATLQGQIAAGRTGVLVSLLLHDVVTHQVIDQVTVQLQTPPTTFERFLPLLGVGVALVAVAGVVTPMIRGWSKR